MPIIVRDEPRTLPTIVNKTQSETTSRHVQIFADTLPELVAWIDSTPGKWSYTDSRTGGASQSWDLNAGWEGTQKLARDGWSDGAADIDARLQAIIPAASHEPRWGYGLAGSRPNIGRLLKGNPKHMVSKRKHDFGAAPVLHLVCNMNASCMINAEQMRNYGTALVGLIDRLENTGKRVHLDVLYVVKEREARVAIGWNVKQASEHCDLSAIAFSIAHPAAFRRLGFAMIERTSGNYENGGYGYCADVAAVDVIGLDETQAKAAMLLDGVNHEPGRCNTPADALMLAIEQINKAAVIAGHATPDNPLIPDVEEFFAVA